MKEKYTDAQKAQLNVDRKEDHNIKIAGKARGVMDRGARHTRLEVTGTQVEEARAEMKLEKMEKQLNLKKFTDEMFKAQADGDYSAVRMLALTIADKMKEKPNTFYEKTTIGDFTIQVRIHEGRIRVGFSSSKERQVDEFNISPREGEGIKDLAEYLFSDAVKSAERAKDYKELKSEITASVMSSRK